MVTPDSSVTEAAAKADAAFDAALSGSTPAAPTPEPASPAATEVKAPEAEKVQAEGSTPVAEAAPVAPEAQDAPEFQNLLAKYNGDKNAAAKAYWETNNRASQLAREKEELAAKLEALQKGGPPAQTEQPKPQPETPPELRWYDEKMRAAENLYKSQDAEKGKWVKEGERLDQAIQGLVFQLNSNDLAVDRDKLYQDLVKANADRQAVTAWVANLDQKMQSLSENWEAYRANKTLAEKLLATEKEIRESREAKATSEEQAFISRWSETWNGTIDRIAKDSSVIPQKLSERFVKYVKAQGKAYVADGNPIDDVEKFVREQATDFISGMKEFHQEQSAEYAKLKKDDVKFTGPTGPNAIAPEEKRARSTWTPQQWEAYLENVNL